jgi:hypothetical protein
MALDWTSAEKSTILDLIALVVADQERGLEWLREWIPKVEQHTSQQFKTSVIAQALLLYKTQFEPWSNSERREAQPYFLDWQRENPSCITKSCVSHEEIQALSEIISHGTYDLSAFIY